MKANEENSPKFGKSDDIGIIQVHVNPPAKKTHFVHVDDDE